MSKIYYLATKYYYETIPFKFFKWELESPFKFYKIANDKPIFASSLEEAIEKYKDGKYENQSYSIMDCIEYSDNVSLETLTNKKKKLINTEIVEFHTGILNKPMKYIKENMNPEDYKEWINS